MLLVCLCPSRRQDSTLINWCCASGGVSMVLSTLSRCQSPQASLLIFTVSSRAYQPTHSLRIVQVMLHDNPHFHNAMTGTNLLNVCWEVLPDPPYSPDLTPTDYHPFLALCNSMQRQIFDNEDHLNQRLTTFFNWKPNKFYMNGIDSLHVKRQKVKDNDGDYFVVRVAESLQKLSVLKNSKHCETLPSAE